MFFEVGGESSLQLFYVFQYGDNPSLSLYPLKEANTKMKFVLFFKSLMEKVQ